MNASIKIQTGEEFVFKKQLWKITHTQEDGSFLAMYCGTKDARDTSMFHQHMLRGDWRTDQALFEVKNGKLKCVQEPTGIFFLQSANERYLKAIGIDKKSYINI